MKKLIPICLLVIALTASAATKPAPEQPKADLVLRHGRIYTMDAARSWAESIAIKGGRILFVGDDHQIGPWIGPLTRTVDLSGRFVLPGFIDTHVHPVEAGIGMNRCALENTVSKEQVFEKIRKYAADHPDAEWIVGQGWPLPAFPQANPKKEWLDAIVSDRPAILTAADGHSAWANSKALEIAGITKDTRDPINGRIERNSSGEPSGTLRESATNLVYKFVPPPSLEDGIAGLQDALKVMNGFGITGFQDASVSVEGTAPEARGSMNIYRETEKRALLTARVTGAIYADPEKPIEQIETMKKQRETFNGKYFHATAVKIFADGVIEANTAALLQPYLDKANDAGSLNWQPEKLNPFVERLDQEKFQIHVHAIGDRAIRVALTALEAAAVKNGPRDGRPIIAHLELINPQDIPRFAKLNVIPSFQPLWAYEDSYIKELTVPKLGQQRSRWLYPINSVSVSGATMAMGSDWNVSSVNPLDGIKVAVTRQSPDAGAEANSPFIPQERIDLKTALAAYTIGSAYANFWEKETGSLETGKSADLIVLSENLFEIPPYRINQAKVLLTLLEGQEIYRDPAWEVH